MTEFIAELCSLTTHCELNACLKDLLRDRSFFVGLPRERMQKRFLSQKILTLVEACDMAMSMEAVVCNTKSMQDRGNNINQVWKKLKTHSFPRPYFGEVRSPHFWRSPMAS